MQKRSEESKQKINDILEHYNYNLRVDYMSSSSITLSNGVVLSGVSECVKFKRRVLASSGIMSLGIFDELYSTNETDKEYADLKLKEYKDEISKSGGESLKTKYGSDYYKNMAKGRVPWNKGLVGLKGHSHTEETKRKISIKNSGARNGMFGVTKTDNEKQNQSNHMKNLILNGDFTPNSNNRNTHWESEYNGKKYRSSWEAAYAYYNPNAIYEEFRIPYTFNNKEYIYIVDFIDHINHLAVEVKPRKLLNDPKTIAKIESLKLWCIENHYEFLLVDENYILDNIRIKESDFEFFDEVTLRKVKLLHERGTKNEIG